ncbi:MAG: DUF1559 domain-containing protein [Planctomycetia bacterium]
MSTIEAVSSAPAAVKRPLFSRGEITITVLVVGTLWAALAAAVPGIVEGDRRKTCQARMKQIGTALHAYHNEYQCYPPAYVADENGKPMHSWRVLILPHLGRRDLYERYRFDEPWNSPANATLAAEGADLFGCPSDTGRPAGATNYAALSGIVPHSDWDREWKKKHPGGYYGPRVAAWNGKTPTQSRDFRDGLSNTFLVVEIVDAGVPWMEPRDLDAATMTLGINVAKGTSISSRHGGFAHLLYADGSVRSLSDFTDPTIVGQKSTRRARDGGSFGSEGGPTRSNSVETPADISSSVK